MGKVELRTKGVAFNIADQQQKELYDYALSKSNFSGYIKGLIVRDMLGIPAIETKQESSVNDITSFI
ncbi:hypothetical protein [Ornithinibacillus scapharcae]|uniref:hypothetical protein n=1 Tax=Ornithinibacillus scapharcae TaxID=1147159 RepID=UPI000225B412|nr:hypothetical protein [Ornithinibacillus scapharcae]